MTCASMQAHGMRALKDSSKPYLASLTTPWLLNLSDRVNQPRPDQIGKAIIAQHCSFAGVDKRCRNAELLRVMILSTVKTSKYGMVQVVACLAAPDNESQLSMQKVRLYLLWTRVRFPPTPLAHYQTKVKARIRYGFELFCFQYLPNHSTFLSP